MPGRRYTGRPPQSSAKPKAHKSQRKQKKRAQNALSIAEAQHEDSIDLNRNRRGESEQGLRKRQRQDDEELEGSDEDGGGQRKRPRSDFRDRYGGDADFGSDSEGNEWVTGQVDDDDDESLDSDEAFGESDEDRFEGFAFRGSKGSKQKKLKKRDPSNLLDESEESGGQEDLDSDAESENFAENAVDLHTMLDDNSDENEPEPERGEKDNVYSRNTSDSRHEESSDGEDGGYSSHEEGSNSSIDGEEDEITAEYRSRALQNMVANLGNGDQSEMMAQKARDRAQEELAPTSIVAQSGGLDSLLDALDPAMRKLVGAAVKPTKKSGKGIPGKVDAPLPQRQQARLDRAVAYEKSKETLARWIDTVKQNRRAEHLSFPLINRDEASAKNIDRFKPLDTSKPFNDLEATIQSILVDSGVKTPGGTSQDEEEDDLKLEGAPVKAPSLEEVLAQRAELRKARELLFREEIKARRIKKIKSKAYRKVHRKARERELQKQQQADAENGVFPDEDDQEKLDRLRAEERMGAKHRESKWAKAMKSTGRTAWDEEARSGMLDMARREEELKRRMHGQAIHKDDSISGDSESESDSDGNNEKLQDELFKLRDDTEATGRGSKLANMKFMQRAEAARREQNEETIAQIQRDLNGENTSDESDGEGPGRRKFGMPKDAALPLKKTASQKNEFEEREASEVEDFDNSDDEIRVTTTEKSAGNGEISQAKPSHVHAQKRRGLSQPKEAKEDAGEEEPSGNDWLDLLHKESKQARQKRPKQPEALVDSTIDPSNTHIDIPKSANVYQKEQKSAKNQARQIRLLPSATVDEDNDNGNATSSSGSDSETETPRLTAQQTALQRAFAGDEVVASFEADKAAIAAGERTPSPEADVLPGWGSWTGSGLGKRDRRDRARRNARLQQQTKADHMAVRKGGKNGKKVDRTRRDADLDGVIISERRAPKTAKYLASALPHPFETRAQYERSLRVPVGPEWTTKETFQSSTKPRILLGGGVVKPMEKPSI